MILDSGKSAEPTLIDFRSPEISPLPSGLALPQAVARKAISAASTTSQRLCMVRRARFMRTSFRRHLLSATLAGGAGSCPCLRFQGARRGQDGSMSSDPLVPPDHDLE